MIKALEILQRTRNQITDDHKFASMYDEAIDELLSDTLQLENTALKMTIDRLKIEVVKGVDTSCDGCVYEDKNELMDYSCLECSRYYTDKFKKEGE